MSLNKKSESRARGASRSSVPGRWSPRVWLQHHVSAFKLSIARLLRRPMTSSLTIGVLSLAIALPLSLILINQNLSAFVGQVERAQELTVFLHVSSTQERAREVQAQIAALDGVRSIQIKTPDQGLEEFRQMSDIASALDVLEENPLPYVLIVVPENDRVDVDALERAALALDGVDSVYRDDAWRARLNAWLRFAERFALVVALFLGLGSILIVGNTVRLEVAAKADEVTVLQQLGATDRYIRRPFLYQGAALGLVSGVLAMLILALAAWATQGRLSDLVASYGAQFYLNGPGISGSLSVLAISATFGWLGARVAAGHQLRKTRPTEL